MYKMEDIELSVKYMKNNIMYLNEIYSTTLPIQVIYIYFHSLISFMTVPNKTIFL